VLDLPGSSLEARVRAIEAEVLALRLAMTGGAG